MTVRRARSATDREGGPAQSARAPVEKLHILEDAKSAVVEIERFNSKV